MDKKIIISILCLLITLISLIAINRYPVGDWVSSPLITWFIFIPIIFIELVSIILVCQNIKPNLFFGVIMSLSVISILILIQYIRTH